jgi:pimeloyl-ACP methyl ester carboxylesterase
MTRPTLLFVHGAWHGPWCFEPLRRILGERGWATSAVELPTVHAPGKAALGLADDAAAVRAAVDAVDGPVVVVAHSYGGVPATQGADGPSVAHIVYISAFVLDAGESLVSAGGGVQPDWWDVRDDGLVMAGTAEQSPRDLFYADVPPAEADAAVARLIPQSGQAYRDPVTVTAWRGRPTTYLITEQDAIFPVAAQEALAARAGSATARLAASHSPFLSQPAAVADIIERAAGKGA